jgi:hypothetical protein
MNEGTIVHAIAALRRLRCPVCDAEPIRVRYELSAPVDALEMYVTEALEFDCPDPAKHGPADDPRGNGAVEITLPSLRILGSGTSSHSDAETEAWLCEEFAVVTTLDDVLSALARDPEEPETNSTREETI